MSETHLELRGVTKRFGAGVAVDAVSLEIPRGAFATLLGPSGCGKTTTLRMIAGFYDPDQGDILLGGRRINELPAHRRGTAMVFQDYALFPHMTVYGNVAYGLKLARTPRAGLRERVDETLQFVGLEALAARYPNQLSGGQQQRVALARALAIRPEVLLLDEPLSNLDARLREQLRWELRSLQRRLGMTFVYVTHDQGEAMAMSDWIAVMNEGRVEQAGSPSEIYNRPRTRFLAAFVGSVNLIPGRVVGREQGRLRVAAAGLELRVLDPGMPGCGDDLTLCVRPESLGLVAGGGQDAAEHAGLAGTVVRSAFLGSFRRYWVQAAGLEWLVDAPDPGTGEGLEGEVVISVAEDRVHAICE